MIRLTLASALLSAAAFSPALAQDRSVDTAPSSLRPLLAQYYYEDPRTTRRQLPQQRVCVPWCPADQNPCDPPEFKRADGRCDQDE